MKNEAQRRSLIRQMAINEHVDGGRTEIHTDAEISEGEDNGAYVQAWVWVSFAGTELDKEDLPAQEVWLAGYNMPGYMPDNEPAECESFDEAKAHIIFMMKEFEDQDWDRIQQLRSIRDQGCDDWTPTLAAELETLDDKATEYCHGAEHINLCGSEFSHRFGDYVFWVTKDTK